MTAASEARQRWSPRRVATLERRGPSSWLHFTFDKDTIAQLKALKTGAHWNGTIRSWQVPIEALPQVIRLFDRLEYVVDLDAHLQGLVEAYVPRHWAAALFEILPPDKREDVFVALADNIHDVPPLMKQLWEAMDEYRDHYDAAAT